MIRYIYMRLEVLIEEGMIWLGNRELRAYRAARRYIPWLPEIG